MCIQEDIASIYCVYLGYVSCCSLRSTIWVRKFKYNTNRDHKSKCFEHEIKKKKILLQPYVRFEFRWCNDKRTGVPVGRFRVQISPGQLFDLQFPTVLMTYNF